MRTLTRKLLSLLLAFTWSAPWCQRQWQRRRIGQVEALILVTSIVLKQRK